MGGSRIEWIATQVETGDCLKLFSENNEYVLYCHNKNKQKLTLSSKKPTSISNALVQQASVYLNNKKLFNEGLLEYKIISKTDQTLDINKQLDLNNLEQELNSGDLVEIITEQNSYVFHYWYNDAQTLPLFSDNLVLDNINRSKKTFIFSSLKPGRQDYLARGNLLAQYVGILPEEELLFQEHIKAMHQILSK